MTGQGRLGVPSPAEQDLHADEFGEPLVGSDCAADLLGEGGSLVERGKQVDRDGLAAGERAGQGLASIPEPRS